MNNKVKDTRTSLNKFNSEDTKLGEVKTSLSKFESSSRLKDKDLLLHILDNSKSASSLSDSDRSRLHSYITKESSIKLNSNYKSKLLTDKEISSLLSNKNVLIDAKEKLASLRFEVNNIRIPDNVEEIGYKDYPEYTDIAYVIKEVMEDDKKYIPIIDFIEMRNLTDKLQDINGLKDHNKHMIYSDKMSHMFVISDIKHDKSKSEKIVSLVFIISSDLGFRDGLKSIMKYMNK